MDFSNLAAAFASGDHVADVIFFHNRKFFKVLKYILLFLVVFGLVMLFKSCTSASALGITHNVYGDLYGTDNNSSRLLSFVPERENYIVARTGEYEYILFYSIDGFEFSNNKFTSSDVVNYVRYYRTGSYPYVYEYESGSINSLTLNLNNYVVCSNNDDYNKSSRSWSYDDRSDTVTIKYLCFIFLPILLFANLWGCLKHDSI